MAKARESRVKIIIETILILVLTFSLLFIVVNLILDKKSEKKMDDLRGQIKASRIQFEEINIPDEAIADNERKAQEKAELEEMEEGATEDKPKPKVLQIYKELHDKNENFAGWLYVDGTNLEYPIMKGPDNEFYLSHDMDGAYDKHGMLIMDDHCKLDADNAQLIIYGHNVNTGKLFGELLFYKEEAYCNYHPVISFDTIYEQGNYEIFSAFITTVTDAQKESGIFTSFTFDDEESFNKLVKWAKEKSLYNRDYTPNYGDDILTLVTCEHSNDEGRFVVMAGRKQK